MIKLTVDYELNVGRKKERLKRREKNRLYYIGIYHVTVE